MTRLRVRARLLRALPWALVAMLAVAAIPAQGYTPPTQATGTSSSPTFSGLTVTGTETLTGATISGQPTWSSSQTLPGLTMGGTLTLGAHTLALASATVSGQPTWGSSQTLPGLTLSTTPLGLPSGGIGTDGTAVVQSSFFAAPSGAAGSAAFRTLVAADVPGMASTATLPTNIKSTLNPVSGTTATYCTLAIPNNSGGSCEISATIVVTDGSNNQDVRQAGELVAWRNKAGTCGVAAIAFGSDNPTASNGSVSAVGLSASVSGTTVSLTCTPTWTTIAPSAGQVAIIYTIKALNSSVAGVVITPQQ